MNPIIEEDIRRVMETNAALPELMDRTIAVTGATGFVGSFLIHTIAGYALAHGCQVKILAMVRNEQKGRAMFGAYEDAGLLEFLVGDVAAPCSYAGKVDYIIHCASNAGPREYGQDPVGTIMTNMQGTYNLLNLAKEKQVTRFLYVSTIEIYGAANVSPITENDYGFMSATNVRSCYPLSKKASENLSICYGDQYQVPVVIGRLSYLYGPGMKKEDSKVVAQFPRLAAAGEEIVMKSKGDQLRSYTYITDAASALITVLVKGEKGQAYNIANPNSTITIADMARTLVDLRKDRGAALRFDLPSETELKRFSFIADAVLDTQRIESLGYHAEVDMRTGLDRVLQSIELEEA